MRCTSLWRTTSWWSKRTNAIPSIAVEDALHLDQPGGLVARKVDLRHVAGHDHLRAEAEAREEHLHLLRRGVLGLVEDDEAVVQRVVRDEEVVRDVQGVCRRDGDAHGFLLADGLDRLDEAHRAAASVAPVDLELSLKAERLDRGRQPKVHDERVVAVLNRPTVREPGRTTESLAPPPVRDATERAHEVHDVVA